MSGVVFMLSKSAQIKVNTVNEDDDVPRRVNVVPELCKALEGTKFSVAGTELVVEKVIP